MDANSKLGPKYIEQDPNAQSQNGKLLADVMNRHALTVVNGLKEKCVGVITREKCTVEGVERSVIDFVITSSDLVKHIQSMHIDEKRTHVLTKLIKTKKGKIKHTKKVESDHNVIETKLNIPWKTKADKPLEVFNFKDKLSQDKFHKLTSETNHLTKVFDTDKKLEVQTKKFIRRLNGFVHESFKKIKIVSKSDTRLEDLYNKRRYLKSKDDKESEEALERVEDELAERYGETMYQKIRKEVKAMSCEEGGFNPGKLWQLKKKLSPKHTASPTAMRDSNGKILTTDEEVKAEAIKHYKNVFKEKLIDKELTNVQHERELLSEERLKSAYKNKTPMWTVEDVQNAIKDLNVGVSKDPYGWPNELFKEGIAGKDLLRGVTILMNKIKENPQDYPTSIKTRVTSAHSILTGGCLEQQS